MLGTFWKKHIIISDESTSSEMNRLALALLGEYRYKNMLSNVLSQTEQVCIILFIIINFIAKYIELHVHKSCLQTNPLDLMRLILQLTLKQEHFSGKDVAAQLACWQDTKRTHFTKVLLSWCLNL